MIKRYREELNLTQEELATALHVKQPTIADWENGKTRPKTARLNDIAMVLGIDVAKLLAHVTGTSGSFNLTQGENSSSIIKAKNPRVRISGETIGKSLTDELRELAQLKKEGLLTEEEFSLAKRRLLNE